MKEVQAFISNLSFPQTYEEFLEVSLNSYYYSVGMILDKLKEMYFTVPRWAKEGDIIFFMHSKTSITYINRMDRLFQEHIEEYTDEQIEDIEWYLDWGRENYENYGGKIFALARVGGQKEIRNPGINGKEHWGRNIYAPIVDICLLDFPLAYDQFKDKIILSKVSGITPIVGSEFTYLMRLIDRYNQIDECYEKAKVSDMLLNKTTSSNWIKLSMNGRNFILEKQLRLYYTDYLLNDLSDDHKIYQEVRCNNAISNQSYVDNAIMFNGKYLPVEIKLDINNEIGIKKQLSKYIDLSGMYFTKRNFVGADMTHNFVLVIDCSNVYIYDGKEIKKIYDLDMIKSKVNIKELRQIIEVELNV